MSMALTTSPLRALHYIKANFPRATFLAIVETMFKKLWTPPHVNLTQDDKLTAVLAEATDGSGRPLFTADDVSRIMAGREGMKDVVKAETQKAVDLGAFGAPWIWATNAKGDGAPFFGSDR
jgi:2-hydroxychromene-2-carboxylate isomerase